MRCYQTSASLLCAVHLRQGDLLNGFDKKTLKRFQELEHLEDDKKKTLFDLIDTYIRDAKARKAYA
ncbi:MAG: hypothetical protein J0I84_06275 [Terrimonas sp.]|nr:hypothetical protein [Terrimonas sp.]OJY90732.1 MAG: hypothetical protein BGP13_22715 [Sphingobacteriales bacterium 40-81]